MRRDIVVNPITQTVVSIHASVKDATDGEGINVDFTHVSIHASVKDATLFGSIGANKRQFQSTHL